MKNVWILFLILSATSCVQQNTVVKTDTAEIQTKTEISSKAVAGTVMEIQQGKDGYTAKIRAASGEFYFVTISHANLKDHNQYKTVRSGEVLKVTGDLWKEGQENHITVREIL